MVLSNIVNSRWVKRSYPRTLFHLLFVLKSIPPNFWSSKITKGHFILNNSISAKLKIYLKWNILNFDRSITFCFGVSSNLSQEKSPTAEILGKYFLRTIVPRKYMRKISAVGLFCCDKFEETPKQKVIDLSKFKKIYFSKKDNWKNFRIENTIHKTMLRLTQSKGFLLSQRINKPFSNECFETTATKKKTVWVGFFRQSIKTDHFFYYLRRK